MRRNILSIGETGRVRELTVSGPYSKRPALIISERFNAGSVVLLRLSFAEAIRLNYALTTVMKQIKEGKYDPGEDSLFIDGVDGFDLSVPSKEEEAGGEG